MARLFHHFPLRGAPFALAAAVVAECAHRDGRFFDMLLALAEAGEGRENRPGKSLGRRRLSRTW